MKAAKTEVASASPGLAESIGQLVRRARNRLRQLTHPGRKVFIIGPHRCATTTLHQFFSSQGLVSFHWRKGEIYLAKEINARMGDDRALRAFLSKWTVYSDLLYLGDDVLIENHTQFRKFEQLFPEAYFIFNDRDVDRWVNSRLLHRDGNWVSRYLQACGGTREQAIATWKKDFEAHRVDTLEYFKGNPRFFHFRIDDPAPHPVPGRQRIDDLIDLLGADYSLSNSQWKSYNTARAGRTAPETEAR